MPSNDSSFRSEVHRLQTAEGALYTGQAFVVAHGLLAGEYFRGDISANNIDAIQRFFLLDVGLLALVREAIFLDVNLKVLSHFVMVQYFAHAQADILLAAQRALGAARGPGN